MPKGKGTYGSQVGRPPKKYQVGGEVGMNADPFSTKNAFGVPAGEAMKEMNKKNVMEGLKEAGKASRPPQGTPPNAPPGAPPTANAQERSQTYQLGGDVLEYKEGGPVKSSLESDPMKLKDRRLAKTPPKKGGGYTQSSKQKEEDRVAAEKAKKRIAKEKMEYGKPKKKKKWSGQA